MAAAIILLSNSNGNSSYYGSNVTTKDDPLDNTEFMNNVLIPFRREWKKHRRSHFCFHCRCKFPLIYEYLSGDLKQWAYDVSRQIAILTNEQIEFACNRYPFFNTFYQQIKILFNPEILQLANIYPQYGTVVDNMRTFEFLISKRGQQLIV